MITKTIFDSVQCYRCAELAVADQSNGGDTFNAVGKPCTHCEGGMFLRAQVTCYAEWELPREQEKTSVP